MYFAFGFQISDDAWQYLKKFLTDGILAFEIIFTYNDDGDATDVSGFKEIDPLTIKPHVKKATNGDDIKGWVQDNGTDDDWWGYNGISQQTFEGGRTRFIPDTNIIYISWNKGEFEGRISYVERLVRGFNTLRQIENSRIIWNMQNAQKKVNITVPTGGQNMERMKTRLSEFEAMYKEDIRIDTTSGEIFYNGQPNFPFSKTYIVPSNENGSIQFAEVGGEGYNLDSVEQLTYFWDRFISETQIPRNRFTKTVAKGTSENLTSQQNTTREEYAFNRFINRIRAVFKELLVKPTWVQFILKHPEYTRNKILRNSIAVKFNEENLFTLYKERQLISDGA